MRILVVDDDALAGLMTGTVLEAAGHDVVLADSGGAALAALSGDAAIALVVSDMHMPGQNGIELFRAMRADGLGIQFILLTGSEPAALLAAEPRLDACVVKDETIEHVLPATVAEVGARHRIA